MNMFAGTVISIYRMRHFKIKDLGNTQHFLRTIWSNAEAIQMTLVTPSHEFH